MPPLALNLYKSAVSLLLLTVTLPLAQVAFFPAEAEWKDYGLLILSGFLGITISDSLFFKSLNWIGAGRIAIVECFYSPSILFLCWAFLAELPHPQKILGGVMVIGAVLIAALQRNKEGRTSRQILYGIILGVLAMMTLALAVIVMKSVIDKTSPLWATEVRLLTATVTLSIQILLCRDRKEQLASLVCPSVWRTAFPAAFLGSFLSLLLWMGAFKFTDIGAAAILNQTSTVFIVVLATIFLKEPLTLKVLCATTIAFAGVAIVTLSNNN